MQLDLCPNCQYPVIYYNPGCSNHTSARSYALAHNPDERTREKKEAPENRPSLEELLYIFAECFEMGTEEIRRSRKGNSPLKALARRLFMFVAYIELSYPQKDIGAFLSITHGVSPRVVVMGSELETNKRAQKYHAAIKARIAERELA